MSILTRQADLAHVLADCGVVVTLGAASTYGSVRLASAEEVAGEGAPALQAQLCVITIVTGSLPALTGGVTITVGGAAHRVHRHFDAGDGVATRIVAYPTEQPKDDFWVAGMTLLPWASRGIGAPAGDVFDTSTNEGASVLVLEVEAGAVGTDPVLSVTIFHCATETGTFVDSGLAFDDVGDEGGVQALALDSGVERYVRLEPTVSGTDDPAIWCGASVLDFSVPR